MSKIIEGNLTIENAADIAAELKNYMKSTKNPVIDISAVEKIDLSGIQLLIAAQKSGEKQKKEVLFSGQIKKPVYDRIFSSGFNTVHSDESRDMFKIRRNSSEF